jgi:pimeloyl-ACP methyl ester carboxylesterase
VPATIASRTASIDGLQLHYLIAGSGPAVLLLHGYTQTSQMWRPIIPLLAEKFTVIAVDLPGIGDSSVPADNKIDMITAAKQIHDLVRSLKIDKARVVGHDIGLMVAYAYAAQFPGETEKLAVMDAFIPGVPGWEPIYNNPNTWHFRFNGEYPEKLVKGRERTYFEYFWNVLAADKTHSIPEADRKAYTAAYSRPGRMREGWEVEEKGGSEFGVEGLRQSIRSNFDQSTESLLEAIISDVYKFGDSTVLTDDACLVAAEL